MTRLSKISLSLRAAFISTALPLALATCLMPSAIAAETVSLNKTHVMRLNGPASSIVLGNPGIADITVFSDTTLLVFGRGYGETDLLVLDEAGNTLVHTDIHVIDDSSSAKVSIISGGAMNRRTYSCRPYCRPAPSLADDPEYKAANGPETSGDNAAAEISALFGSDAQGGQAALPDSSMAGLQN